MINFGVRRKKNEPIDKMINRFKKKTKENKLMDTLTKNRFFVPKSEIKRKKKDEQKYLQNKNKYEK